MKLDHKGQWGLAACLIFAAILITMTAWRIPAQAVVLFGLMLLCPLLHLLIMKHIGDKYQASPPASIQWSNESEVEHQTGERQSGI